MAAAPKVDPKKAALLVALRKGDAARVSSLLAANAAEQWCRGPDTEADSAGNLLLHRACRHGASHEAVVSVLLAMGGRADAANRFGMTPLHHAAVAGDECVVRRVVEAAQKQGVPNVSNMADSSGRVPLHWACSHAHVEAVRMLLTLGKADADVADREGYTPLLRACQQKPPETKQGRPVDKVQDEQEQVPEEEVVSPEEVLSREDSSRCAVADLLLEHGASVAAKEPKGGHSALHLAAINGYWRTCGALCAGGADVDTVNVMANTPLMYACRERRTDVVRELLRFSPRLSASNALHFEWTALHFSALEDDAAAVGLLLAAGADSGVRDALGRTPLQLAEEHRKENAAKELRKRGK